MNKSGMEVAMQNKMIRKLMDKILSDEKITKDEALALAEMKEEDLELLFKAANEIREHFLGNQVNLCSIINAKSGSCSEDCKFCAQSGHYQTNIVSYPLIDGEIAVKNAKQAEHEGVHHFSLVTSGKGISSKDFSSVLNIYQKLKTETKIKLCASLGIISYEKAKALQEIGVTTYHHNLETSRNFYANICTTHTYDQRIETIVHAKKAGLNVCSGGIIGLGETMEDRIDMALDLQKLKINSVPINILVPIEGTPLANQKPLSPNEILKTIAIFRFILPKAHIRYAGGRMLLGEYQAKGLKAGISAILVGNYLTTAGSSINRDKLMLEELGLRW